MKYAPKTMTALEQGVLDDRDDEWRWHLGASVIGRDCARQVWYMHRWAAIESFEPRMLRLFDRGNREEHVFVALLRRAGVVVSEVDPVTGDQFRISDVEGHFGGSLDAEMRKLPDLPREKAVLGEFKTHNDKSFQKLVKQGVRESKHEHFIQMQIYMRKRGLKWALYCAVNKNDDTLHFELVKLEEAEADKYIKRAAWIIHSAEAPPRISNDPSWWQCGYCTFKGVCHGNDVPAVNCRTCAHSTPIADGQWLCEHHRVTFAKPTKEQEEAGEPSPMALGCESHVFNPHMLNGVELLGGDTAANYAELRLPGGAIIKQGPAHVRSIDLELL